MGNLFHLLGPPVKPWLPCQFHVLLSSISLFKVACSFKCWLESDSYLGKGAWWKELQWPFLENQAFCLTHIGWWSWNMIGIQTPEYLHLTFPWFSPTHRRKDTPSCKPLLEWFRCSGPKGKALYKLENLLSPLLFYYCLNWFIHCNWVIMDNIAYVTLDASLDCSWNVLLSLGPLERDVFEMNWVADVWIFCRH